MADGHSVLKEFIAEIVGRHNNDGENKNGLYITRCLHWTKLLIAPQVQERDAMPAASSGGAGSQKRKNDIGR